MARPSRIPIIFIIILVIALTVIMLLMQGNATCSSEQRGQAEKFTIQYHPDGSGRWAIRNRVTTYCFGGTDDMIQCYEKQPGQSEWWFVHLAIHPQVRAISATVHTSTD